MEKEEEFIGMLEKNRIISQKKEEGDKYPQYIYAAIGKSQKSL